MRHGLCALLMMLGGAAQALELQLPVGARQMISRDTVQDRFFAPVAPFANGTLPTEMVTGAVTRGSWRIDTGSVTPSQIVSPMITQLEQEGFRIVLDCDAQACGGYDFRFAVEVLPAPNMHVNIRDYRVLTALRGPAGAPDEAVMILASASSGASFVQIIQAGAVAPAAVQATAPLPQPSVTFDAVEGSMGDILLREGHVVLDGLDFGSGTSALGEGPFASLGTLAQALETQPTLRVALVGHTDNKGSLDGNIALARNRANAVRTRLIERYGVAANRLEAEGMGYLAPHTTNLTEAGREANRRVEAIILAN